MALREGLAANGLVSDSAPLSVLLQAMLDLAPRIRFMRDPTRGGLAAVLNELCAGQNYGAFLEENKLPFNKSALALAEMLGIDPLQVASEGRLIAVCERAAGEEILSRWRKTAEGKNAVCLGEIRAASPGRVVLETVSGGRRLVDLPLGELLPRIC
jgi:hydrogenase expression/formation protein HypE